MDQKQFKIIFKIIFFFWLFLIFITSIYPGNLIGLIFKGNPNSYPGGQVSNLFFEYFGHFISYFLLSFFAIFAFDFNDRILGKVSFLLIFAFIMELLHIFIPNRSYENYDLAMNILGVLFGLFFLLKSNQINI
jgi:VanZ family protein